MTRRVYQFIDGKEFSAETDQELVEKIRVSSWMPSKTAQEYMKAFSGRARILLNIHVSPESPEAFVRDLLKFKIIAPIMVN